MRWLLVLAASTLLAGCGELQKLITPPLDMTLELRGPAGGEVSLVISGHGINEVFTDNGLGLSTKLPIRPGSYTATLSELRIGPIHYRGYLTFANANGNTTRAGSLVFQVRDLDTKTLRLVGTYRATTGSLRVNASGLPFGVVPRITYRSASGEEGVFNPVEPAALVPGSYQVRFEPVEVDGRIHTPTPSTVVVVVEAGSFASVNVTYAEAR